MDTGSSYVPSELNAAYLYAQLEKSQDIFNDRMNSWNRYYDGLLYLREKEFVDLPSIPKECGHNAHMFYIKAKDLAERTRLIEYLKQNEICAVFHYIPLHSAPAGKKFGEFRGTDLYTTIESEKLLRLPLFYGLIESEIDYIIEKIYAFYGQKVY